MGVCGMDFLFVFTPSGVDWPTIFGVVLWSLCETKQTITGLSRTLVRAKRKKRNMHLFCTRYGTIGKGPLLINFTEWIVGRNGGTWTGRPEIVLLDALDECGRTD